jgi:hypothetical protein
MVQDGYSVYPIRGIAVRYHSSEPRHCNRSLERVPQYTVAYLAGTGSNCAEPGTIIPIDLDKETDIHLESLDKVRQLKPSVYFYYTIQKEKMSKSKKSDIALA